ncbi:sensor histidine kinase [Paenibacillus sp. GCM10023252]|uniref:cache domain-containing sensor histidine kinase n=1 Tax=Paenibacillus sp. GCM10023252 TaxID=3252649 RepID=UPI0036071F60
MIQKVRSSLHLKLIILISMIIIMVVTAIGSFSFYKSSSAIDSDVTRFSNQILKQANYNLTRYINDNEQFFQTIAGSQDFRKWSSAAPDDTFGLYHAYKSIEDRFIIPYISYHPEVLSVILYNPSGSESIYQNPDLTDTVLDPEYSLANLDWVQKLDATGKALPIVKVRDEYYDRAHRQLKIPVLTYYQKLTYDNHTSYLALDISLLHVQKILNEIELGADGVALIADQTGRVLSSPDMNQITKMLEPSVMEAITKESSGSTYDAEEKRFIVYQSIPKMNWKVIVFVPYSNLAQSITEIRNWTIVMTVVSLLVAIALVYWVSHSITSRIMELMRAMKMTKMNRFDVRIALKGTDEVAELSDAYNLLLDRIEQSIVELTESRLVQQRAILSALQSQIHSHFLYNALESINAMANLANQHHIRRTAIALSKMLRYTSNYQETLVRVEDEISHIKDYLHIMQNLYPDKIEYSVDVDSLVSHCSCLKAIVQPFVENSIKHGFEMTGHSTSIQIRVRLYQQEYIRIDIEDDGIGIMEDKLQELQQALDQTKPEQEYLLLSRVGMLNVQYRLKTFYNQDPHTGITIERVTELGGNRISLTFPIQSRSG